MSNGSQQARISRLRVPDESEIDDSVRPILEMSKNRDGSYDNWRLAVAVNPGTLTRAAVFLGSIFEPKNDKLTLAEKEMIAVVVSAETGCSYCVTHHVKNLAKAMKDPIRAQRFALGHDHVPDITPKESAIADLAVKMSRDPGTITDGDIDRLREVGMDDSEIMAAMEVAAAFNYSSRLTVASHIIPQDDLFDLS